MKIKDLMTSNVLYAKPDASVEKIAQLMKEQNIGSIPVCNDNGEVLGIVTDRDIVLRAISVGNMNATAKDIMSSNVVYANSNMSAHDAANLMAKNQIRRLPIIDNNKLVGIVAMADIARKNIYVDEAGNALSAISKPGQFS
ncbi:MAG: CBS domain-containing protein [Clostridiales bacterium]|nr:CBS domain-containing protein [Clostridiales bacterium]